MVDYSHLQIRGERRERKRRKEYQDECIWSERSYSSRADSQEVRRSRA